jgi:hypothetical protein
MCCGRCLESMGRRLRFRRWTALYRLPARESGYWPPLGGNFSNSLSIALSSFWVFFSGLLESVSLAMPRQTTCLLLPSYMSITRVSAPPLNSATRNANFTKACGDIRHVDTSFHSLPLPSPEWQCLPVRCASASSGVGTNSR